MIKVGDVVTVWTAYAETPEPVYSAIVMGLEESSTGLKYVLFNEEIEEETTVPERAVRAYGESF